MRSGAEKFLFFIFQLVGQDRRAGGGWRAVSIAVALEPDTVAQFRTQPHEGNFDFSVSSQGQRKQPSAA